MEKPVVGAINQFHDSSYLRNGASRFVPTPERTRLFNFILSEIRAKLLESGQVVEPGIGPGYLAGFMLDAPACSQNNACFKAVK